MNQQELIAAVAEEVLRRLPKPSEPAAAPAVQDDDMSDSGSEEPTAAWSSVLGTRRQHPVAENGKRLAKMLESPPELQALKTKAATVLMYSGVPETPPPRRNKVDNNLCNCQKKVETAMHLLVNFMEKGDLADIGTTAAFLRSVHQDLQEQRRSYLAGRQSWKLDPRQDDQRPKLLSVEEEKKIRQPQDSGRKSGEWKGKQPFQPTPPGWGKGEGQGRWYQKPRGRSRSQSHGKGKGKGQK